MGKRLKISGERSPGAYEDRQRLRNERPSGSFSRVITLPKEVDPDAVSAKLDSGVLTITLPKVEAVKPRTIEVS